MPARVRDALAHGFQHEAHFGRVAGVVGAGQAIGHARAAAEMRDHHDPAACPEMMRDGLRIAAVAAAFQAVEQDQRGRVGVVRQGLPVRFRHPAGGGGLAVDDGTLPADRRAVGGLVREQPRTGPVEVDEIGVGRIHPFAHERDAVILREQGSVNRLAVASGQPGGNGAGRSIKTSSGQRGIHPVQCSISGTSCKSSTPASVGAGEAWCMTMRQPVGPLW